MTGYRFTLSCPKCGAPVEEVTRGRVVEGEESAIVRCVDKCQRGALNEWHVSVTLRPFVDRTAVDGDQGCGTVAGYGRHRRRGEAVCGACAAAHATYENPLGAKPASPRPTWEAQRIAARQTLAEVMG